VVEALVRFVRDQAPGLIILSGDITQRARRSQFRAARAFLDRLGDVPMLVIPGNHDIPLFNPAARIFWPYRNYRRELGGNLEPEFESEDVLAIALNTTRRYRHIDGELSHQQIERAASRLERAETDQLRIVVTHQPVCVTQPEDKHNLLHGSDEAVRRWAAAGADLILGGHIHLPYVCALHESMEGLPRRTWAVQAGTATSARVRYGAENSANLIRYRNGANGMQCEVERWDYQSGLLCFVPVVSHVLDCERVPCGANVQRAAE
jgi:3',5'-cyclic AMP phosphodiesterase CpdA